MEEEEEEGKKEEEDLLSKAGKTQFLKDIESVGGPWSCTKGNRKFAQICDRNQALYVKKGSRERRVAQNLVTYWKTKSTAAKYVEELIKREIIVSDSTRAKLQQELTATGTGPSPAALLPLPAAVTSPPSVPSSQQRKVASTAGKRSSQKKKSATPAGLSSQKKSSTSQKQTPFSSPRELFPDSTMQNSKQANPNDPNNPRIPLRYQNHESCT